jgi:hypothetical protein
MDSSADVVSKGDGNFEVSGSHLYQADGDYDVNVYIFDKGQARAPFTAIAHVHLNQDNDPNGPDDPHPAKDVSIPVYCPAMFIQYPPDLPPKQDPPPDQDPNDIPFENRTLQVYGTTVQATAEETFSGSVATLSGYTGGLKAKIDWGDKTITDGTIDSGHVNGSHTYQESGAETITVTLSPAEDKDTTDTRSYTIFSGATIVRPNFSISGKSVPAGYGGHDDVVK